MTSAKSTRRHIFKSIGVAEAAALIVGLLYVTGYYVNSVFLRNYGIPDAELIRLEYIKIGFVFWVITMGIVLLPLGSFLLTWRIRRASKLPHFYAGWIGNSLNSAVMLGVPLLLSFLATRFEWEYPFPSAVLGFRSFNVAVGTALGLASFGVIVVPLLERLVVKYAEQKRRKIWFSLLIEPLRFGCLTLAAYLITASCCHIPWMGVVLGRAGSYVAVAYVFVIGAAAAIRWILYIENIRGSTMVYPLILFGVCFFYYLAISSYVFGIYPSIPANRGGRMPLTEAFFEVSEHDHLFGEHIPLGSKVVHGPAYILEQTDDSIYFASAGMDRWFRDFVDVHGLRKEDIKYIRLQRITDGFPRTSRPKPPPPQPKS